MYKAIFNFIVLCLIELLQRFISEHFTKYNEELGYISQNKRNKSILIILRLESFGNREEALAFSSSRIQFLCIFQK